MIEAVELAAWRSGEVEVVQWAAPVGEPMRRMAVGSVSYGVTFTERGHHFRGGAIPRDQWVRIHQQVTVHDPFPDAP